MLLARYSPPGVLINEKMEILQFRGETGAVPSARARRAAEQPPQDGASGALVAVLRATIAKAKKKNGAGQSGRRGDRPGRVAADL